MTVVVALSCPEGIVLASDSQETSGQTRTYMRKLYDVNDRLAWGASGETSITERLAAQRGTLVPHLDAGPFELADQILALTTPLQQAGLAGYVPLPNTQPAMMAALYCWCDAIGIPRIFQVNITGSGSCFRHHRAAIGSGGPFADVALASVGHLRTHELDLERLKMVAYKAIQDVIFTSSWGVGWPIQAYTITPAEGARMIDTQELAAVGDSVQLWLQKQRDVLGALGEESETEAVAAVAVEEAVSDETSDEEDASTDPGMDPEPQPEAASNASSIPEADDAADPAS